MTARPSKNEPATSGAPLLDAESLLLARSRAGDRSAFATLIDRHQDRIFTLALRLCGGARERAEDLAQEAFLRALQGITSFRGDAAFSTWMHRIVLNLHLNRTSSLAARAEARQLSLGAARDDEQPGLDVASTELSPDESVGADEELARLRRAVDALDEARRVVVLLRDVEGKSYEEIAALLDVPIGTVRSRLARAREELSNALGGSGFRAGKDGLP